MGLVINNEDAARAAQTAMQKEAVQERLHEKLAAGKVEVSQSKAEREAANTVRIGNQKKEQRQKATRSCRTIRRILARFCNYQEAGDIEYSTPWQR